MLLSPEILEIREGIWVIDKPSGFAVHPTHDPEIPDILTWLVQQQLAEAGLAPIHRLDRDTSGLVLCSPDPQLRGAWSRWFEQRKVHKNYLALVYGETPQRGTIAAPLFDRRRRKSLDAETSYERLEVMAGFSLLELTPHTGRKHQLRRHLQGIGHAIVGDGRYKPKRWRAVPHYPGRLWLHAQRLELPNGWILTSPLPETLEGHLEGLRQME